MHEWILFTLIIYTSGGYQPMYDFYPTEKACVRSLEKYSKGQDKKGTYYAVCIDIGKAVDKGRKKNVRKLGK